MIEIHVAPKCITCPAQAHILMAATKLQHEYEHDIELADGVMGDAVEKYIMKKTGAVDPLAPAIGRLVRKSMGQILEDTESNMQALQTYSDLLSDNCSGELSIPFTIKNRIGTVRICTSEEITVPNGSETLIDSYVSIRSKDKQ